jgi:hypothetical protein
MVDGTRLAQIADSVKECQDAWVLQQTINDNMDQKLADLTDMVCTVLTNQNPPPINPPPEVRNSPPIIPPPEVREWVYHARDERRFNDRDRQFHELEGREERFDRRIHIPKRHEPEQRDDREERWFQEDELQDHHREERHIHTRAMRLDFPRFDGESPYAWTYKVNQFFDYYQTPLYHRIRMASFHMEGEALV